MKRLKNFIDHAFNTNMDYLFVFIPMGVLIAYLLASKFYLMATEQDEAPRQDAHAVQMQEQSHMASDDIILSDSGSRQETDDAYGWMGYAAIAVVGVSACSVLIVRECFKYKSKELAAECARDILDRDGEPYGAA